MSTKIMPVTDLCRMTKAVIKSVKDGGDVVYITQHGRPTAVLIAYEAYEALVSKADKAKVDEKKDADLQTSAKPFHPLTEEEKQTARDNGCPEGFFEKFFGAIQDETFYRHPQGEYEEREPIE